MNAIIEQVKDLKELALFLSDINQHKASHIGFCGIETEEIMQTLTEDFIRQDGGINFWMAKDRTGTIIAAIGLDVDGSEAEVWGPFSHVDSHTLQHELWETLMYESPRVQEFYFFINKENRLQQRFMEEIEAEMSGEHLTLIIDEGNFHQVQDMKSIPYTPGDYHAFEKLHNKTFPNTYYDAGTITKRLGNGNSLRMVKTSLNELQGYAYYEVNAGMGDASLEYIAVSKSAQSKGVGTMLLKEVLTEMFSYPQINDVVLTVENDNSPANHVYFKAGFKPKDTLLSYSYKVR